MLRRKPAARPRRKLLTNLPGMKDDEPKRRPKPVRRPNENEQTR